MKRQVRIGVFETNSSSTHSLVVCTKEEYEKWKSGELYCDNGKFFTEEEVINEARKHDLSIVSIEDVDLLELDIFSFENWGYGYERGSKTYKTNNGEEIVIRYYHGYNG